MSAGDREGTDESGTIRTDLFTVEIMSAWGDTWIWSDIVLDDVMDVYETLGDPGVFYRLGHRYHEDDEHDEKET